MNQPETTADRHPWQVGGALWLRALGHAVVCLVLFGGFYGFFRLLGLGMAVEQPLLHSYFLESRFPFIQAAWACAFLFVLLVLGDSIDRLRGKQTRSPLALVMPLLLVVAWIAPRGLVAAVFSFTVGWFGLRKLLDHVNVWNDARGWRLLLRVEGFVLLGLAPAMIALAIFAIDGTFDSAMFVSVGIVFYVLLHAIVLARGKQRIRFYGVWMLIAVVLALIAVEIALAPLQLGLRRAPDGTAQTPRRGDTTQFGGRIVSNVLPGGVFNNLQKPWFIEVDRFRGLQPDKAKRPGVYRVFCVGASATEGYRISRDEDVWPAVLGNKLNALQRSYPIEVFNAGIGGSTTLGMLINLKVALRHYHPDMIILYASYNDQEQAHGPFTEREMYELAISQMLADDTTDDGAAETPADLDRSVLRLQQLFSRSTLYRLWRRRLLGLRETNQTGINTNRLVHAVPLDDFRDNLNEFVSLCRRDNIQLVFIGEACRRDLSRYKKVMAAIARQEKIPYHDANEGLMRCAANPDELFIDDVHLTIPGNECTAGIIADLVEREKLLPEALP